MMGSKIIGHKNILSQLNALNKNNICNTYIFLGQQGIGKEKVAKDFSRQILCNNVNFCQECPSCLTKDLSNHPDFIELASDPERKNIKINEIRELAQKLVLKPLKSSRRVCLINDFDQATHEAQNAFLKTLEDRNKNIAIILIVENLSTILPTIISRSQLVKFSPLTKQELTQFAIDCCPKLCENKFALEIAAGRPGKLKFLDESKNYFKALNAILVEKIDCQAALELSGKIYDKINIKDLIDDFLVYCSTRLLRIGLKEHVQKLLELREISESNANKRLLLDNVFLEILSFNDKINK